MKKIFTLAALALFTLTSCSGDDNSATVDSNTNPQTENPTENAILVKKMIETNQDGEAVTSLFTYDGNKIINLVSSDGTKEMYYYTNDKITKIEYLDNNDLTDTELFEYNNEGKLSISKHYITEWSSGNKYVYTYNTNGTVIIKKYSGDLNTQEQYYGEETITVNNGNITSYITENSYYAYTFDTKNSPLKNITGIEHIFINVNEGGMNNTLSYSYNNENGTDESSTFTYTYNTSSFPLTSTETGTLGTLNIQYFYE